MRLEVSMELVGILNVQGKELRLEGIDLIPYKQEIQQILSEDPAFTFMQRKEEFFKVFEGDVRVPEKISQVEIRVAESDLGVYAKFYVDCGEALNYTQREALENHLDDYYHRNSIREILSEAHEFTEGTMRLEMWQPYTSIFRITEREEETKVRKFEISEIEHPLNASLHRIRALQDIGTEVKKGDLGGFVERPINLSQAGTCWLFGNAIAKDFVRVMDDVQLKDTAQAKGKAVLTGDSVVKDQGVVKGNAYIRNAMIKERGVVGGNAVVENYGEHGMAPVIKGKSVVLGELHGAFVVKDAVIPEKEEKVHKENNQKRVGIMKRKKNQPQR